MALKQREPIGRTDRVRPHILNPGEQTYDDFGGDKQNHKQGRTSADEVKNTPAEFDRGFVSKARW